MPQPLIFSPEEVEPGQGMGREASPRLQQETGTQLLQTIQLRNVPAAAALAAWTFFAHEEWAGGSRQAQPGTMRVGLEPGGHPGVSLEGYPPTCPPHAPDQGAFARRLPGGEPGQPGSQELGFIPTGVSGALTRKTTPQLWWPGQQQQQRDVSPPGSSRSRTFPIMLSLPRSP